MKITKTRIKTPCKVVNLTDEDKVKIRQKSAEGVPTWQLQRHFHLNSLQEVLNIIKR